MLSFHQRAWDNTLTRWWDCWLWFVLKKFMLKRQLKHQKLEGERFDSIALFVHLGDNLWFTSCFYCVCMLPIWYLVPFEWSSSSHLSYCPLHQQANWWNYRPHWFSPDPTTNNAGWHAGLWPCHVECVRLWWKISVFCEGDSSILPTNPNKRQQTPTSQANKPVWVEFGFSVGRAF